MLRGVQRKTQKYDAEGGGGTKDRSMSMLGLVIVPLLENFSQCSSNVVLDIYFSPPAPAANPFVESIPFWFG